MAAIEGRNGGHAVPDFRPPLTASRPFRVSWGCSFSELSSDPGLELLFALEPGGHRFRFAAIVEFPDPDAEVGAGDRDERGIALARKAARDGIGLVALPNGGDLHDKPVAARLSKRIVDGGRRLWRGVAAGFGAAAAGLGAAAAGFGAAAVATGFGEGATTGFGASARAVMRGAGSARGSAAGASASNGGFGSSSSVG